MCRIAIKSNDANIYYNKVNEHILYSQYVAHVQCVAFCCCSDVHSRYRAPSAGRSLNRSLTSVTHTSTEQRSHMRPSSSSGSFTFTVQLSQQQNHKNHRVNIQKVCFNGDDGVELLLT